MSEKEAALKEAYNNYVDCLINYLDEIRDTTAENNARSYLLDSHADIHASPGPTKSTLLVRGNDVYARGLLLKRKAI